MSCVICGRKVKARGWCAGHYERWREGRPMDGPIQEHRPQPPICIVVDCGRDSHAKGLCRKHWQRYRRHGSTEDGRRSTASCGTVAGWWRHYRERTAACGPCVRAKRRYERDWFRTRNGTTNPRIANERVTILDCALDVLETYWPDRLTYDQLAMRVLDVHPEWSEKSVRRVVGRDLKDRAEWDGDRWQARAASWEVA